MLRYASPNTNPTADEALRTLGTVGSTAVSKVWVTDAVKKRADQLNVGKLAADEELGVLARQRDDLTNRQLYEAQKQTLHRRPSKRQRSCWPTNLPGVDAASPSTDEESCDFAATVLAEVTGDLSKLQGHIDISGVLAVLEKATDDSGGISTAKRFITEIAARVERTVELNKLRGEGMLKWGSNTFVSRLVTAYQIFLHDGMLSRDDRLDLFRACGNRATRSARVDDDSDAVLSLLLATATVDAAVSGCLLSAYNSKKSPPTASQVIDNALGAAAGAASHGISFDSIERANLEYITGWVVSRLRRSYKKKHHARAMVLWFNINPLRSLPRSMKLAPTQRLVKPQPVLFRFTRRLETLLQQEVLTPKRALEHGDQLFPWALEFLSTDQRVRRWWDDVQCKFNTAMNQAQKVESKVNKEASVNVLQRFVETYMLSKQRTWRLGMGLGPEAANAAALRTELKLKRHQGALKMKRDVERRLRLPMGFCESILQASAALTRGEGRRLLRSARRNGALIAAQELRQQESAAPGHSDGKDGNDGDISDASVNDGGSDDSDDDDDDYLASSDSDGDSRVSPLGTYDVVLAKPDHGVVFTGVSADDGLMSQRSVQACRVQSVDGARSLGVFGSPAFAVGDYVIGVKRDAARASRTLTPSILLSDSTAKDRPQYPLRLTVAKAASMMLKGLPAAAESVIGSSAAVGAAVAPVQAQPSGGVPFASPPAKVTGGVKRGRRDTPQQAAGAPQRSPLRPQPARKQARATSQDKAPRQRRL